MIYCPQGVIFLTFDKKKYDLEYAKSKLKRIPLDVTIEKYEQIKSHAEKRSETVNGFIKRAIDETITNDEKHIFYTMC